MMKQGSGKIINIALRAGQADTYLYANYSVANAGKGMSAVFTTGGTSASVQQGEGMRSDP